MTTTSADNSPRLRWEEVEDGDYKDYRSQTLWTLSLLLVRLSLCS